MEDHHDRELIIESIVTSHIDTLLANANKDVLDILVKNRSHSQAIAGMIVYENLLDFRAEAIARVQRNERELHIGKHIQDPSEHCFHIQALRAIVDVRDKWQLDNASKLSPILSAVNGEITKLRTLHTYETRWDMAARIEREKAAETNNE